MTYKDEFYKKMLDNLYDGVYFVEKNRKITFWNKGAEMITGFSAGEVLGSYCFDNILNHIDDEGNRLCFEGCPLQKTTEDGHSRSAHVYLHHKDGHRIPVNVRTMPILKDGDIVGSIEIFRDDSEWMATVDQMQRLEKLALTDPLCGVPNRRYAETFIASKIEELRHLDIPFGAIFLDIDDFKHINDTYGHDQGDVVIKTVANTIKGSLRKADMIARWGGEEFVAILVSVDADELKGVAEKIRMLVAKSAIPLMNNGRREKVYVTLSSGAAMAGINQDVNSLIEKVDGLMYLSKHNGKNLVTV